MLGPPSGWENWFWTVGLSGAVIVAGGAVIRLFHERRALRVVPEVLSTELRELLLEQARRHGWSALRRDLIVLPDGFEDLELAPRLSLVSGHRSLHRCDRLDHEEVSNDVVKAFKASSQLLIVGEPGSGKTVLAYMIAEYLDGVHTDSPDNEPIPVVLNLATWNNAATAEEWIVARLCDPVNGFGFPSPTLARQLVTEAKLALILDGLDEVADSNRSTVLTALNNYLEQVGSKRLVVITCRSADYEQMMADHPDQQLALMTARETQPLANTVIARILSLMAKGNSVTPANSNWDTIATAIGTGQGEHELASVFANPLMLALAAETNPDPSSLIATDNGKQPSIEQIRLNLCKAKVDTALKTISPSTKTWLITVATALKQHNQVSFHTQSLTPPQLFNGLVVGLIFGLSIALIVALAVALALGVIVGVTVGAIAGVIVGLIVGFCTKRFGVCSRPTHRRFIVSPPKVANRLIVGLSFGVTGGLIYGVILGLVLGASIGLGSGLRTGVPFGLASGLVYGLTLGLAYGLRSDVTIGDDVEPRDMYRLSLRSYLITIRQWTLVFGLILGLTIGMINGLTSGLGVGLAVGLIGGLAGGLAVGLAVGLTGGLDGGGGFVVLQWLKRRELRKAIGLQDEPVEALMSMCDAERRLLRRAGGGVQFRHDLLREAVADLDDGSYQLKLY